MGFIVYDRVCIRILWPYWLCVCLSLRLSHEGGRWRSCGGAGTEMERKGVGGGGREKDVVGEAGEGEQGGWEARAGAVQSWNGHPELSLPWVAMETRFLPRLHPYRLHWVSFYLSLSPLLRFSSCLFHPSFNLCLCFFFPVFFPLFALIPLCFPTYTHSEHICNDAHWIQVHCTLRWMGNCTVYFAFPCTHRCISTLLFSQHLSVFFLSIFTSPSVQHHASVMPPLVIAFLPTHRAP